MTTLNRIGRSAHGLDAGPDGDRWWLHAACNRGTPAMRDMWFSVTWEQVATARHVCLYHCPVLHQCNAQAVKDRPIDGIWGGVWWARVRNRGYGRQHGYQPLHEGCGQHCARWRYE